MLSSFEITTTTQFLFNSDKRKDNKCYLHVERVDDKFIVVDDLGRQVAMTRNIAISSGYDEVTEITLRFLDANKDNKPHINNINSDLMMEKLTVNEFTGEVKNDTNTKNKTPN
jgi:hypothetical protein